jgi:hypothetical protein
MFSIIFSLILQDFLRRIFAMTRVRCNISFIIVLISLFSLQAFSQQVNYGDSLKMYNPQQAVLKPSVHYSLGSSYMFVPHLGSVTGFTITPYLSVPLSPKWSVEGGIIAGRYYSTLGRDRESGITGGFNEISVFGSASYHVNSQLTLYGSGIKQVTGSSPFNMLPKSSYTIGSTYNFGSFSIGVSVQTSKWNDNLSPFPFNGPQGFYPPFESIPGIRAPFDR